MGCTPSLRLPESGTVYPGGREARETLVLAAPQGALPAGPLGKKLAMGDLQFGPMRFHPDRLQVLLAFAKEDRQCRGFLRAGERAGFKCSVSQQVQAALASFLLSKQDIVVLDLRHPRHLDARALCRAIRSSSVSEGTVILGVVRRRDGEGSVVPLLSAGFTRRFVENPSLLACYTELLQLQCAEVRSQLKLQACNSIFTALEQSHDAVEITGEDHLIQYVNPAFETAMGYESRELIGKELAKIPIKEMRSDLFDTINSCIERGKEWQGVYGARNGENGQQRVKIIPVSGQGGKIRHYVSIIGLVSRSSKGEKRDSVQSEVPADLVWGKYRDRRQSSVRSQSSRGSNMASQRRQSSVVHNQSVTMEEAPITQAIKMISAAQEITSPPVSQALDRVLEILRATELYSPQFGTKDVDSHTNDFLQGLVSQGARRPSAKEQAPAPRVLPPAAHSPAAPMSLQHIPLKITQALENEDKWDFDIFELEAATQNRPLLYLGFKIFARFGICDYLKCSEGTLRLWLQLIENNYHTSNPYHNSTHAADVLHATAYFLCQERIKLTLDTVDEAASLIAAAVHDLDHPGRTNPFLCNSDDSLAILYNDKAVLESHHAALAFQVTIGDSKANIFKNMERSSYQVLRQVIIDMVLATEMTKHFEHLNKFVNSIVKPLVELEGDEETGPDEKAISALLGTPETRVLIKRMMIKCADVSNPCRPLEQCIEWAVRISEEYFAQNEEEKRRGLPVVMPTFDRHTCSIPKAQVSFIDFFITDLYEAWDSFVDLPQLLQHLDSNYRYWKGLDEMKLRTHRPPPEPK